MDNDKLRKLMAGLTDDHIEAAMENAIFFEKILSPFVTVAKSAYKLDQVLGEFALTTGLSGVLETKINQL